MSGNIVIDKPNGISLFNIKTAMSAIRLEAMGMKHSSGRSVRKHWAEQLGLGARAKADVVLAEMQKKCDELIGAGNLGIREV